MDTQQWLTHMESMLSDLTTSWEGLLIITGDMNIDLLKPSNSLAKKYNDLLYTFRGVASPKLVGGSKCPVPGYPVYRKTM